MGPQGDITPYNEGSFTCKRARGDLTRDHYLNSPPIEPSLKAFSHTRKIPRWSGRDSNPRLRAQRQARSPLSHPTTLFELVRWCRRIASCPVWDPDLSL